MNPATGTDEEDLLQDLPDEAALEILFADFRHEPL